MKGSIDAPAHYAIKFHSGVSDDLSTLTVDAIVDGKPLWKHAETREQAADACKRHAAAVVATSLGLPQTRFVRCAHCRERDAVCIGTYEGAEQPSPACGNCCGHGNEDGQCFMFSDHEQIFAMVTRMAKYGDRLLSDLENLEADRDDQVLAAADAKRLLYSVEFGEPDYNQAEIDAVLADSDQYVLRARDIRACRKGER